jgi:hypothetical protein
VSVIVVSRPAAMPGSKGGSLPVQFVELSTGLNAEAFGKPGLS